MKLKIFIIYLTIVVLTLTAPFSPLHALRSYASGSGVFINEHGYLLTAGHVIHNRHHFWYIDGTHLVKLYLVEEDLQNDVAILTTHKHNDHYSPLTSSIPLNQSITAYGYDKGIHILKKHTGIATNWHYDVYMGYLWHGWRVKTTVHGCKGDSGGPVFDKSNRVYGLLVAGGTPGECSSITYDTSIKSTLHYLTAHKIKYYTNTANTVDTAGIVEVLSA